MALIATGGGASAAVASTGIAPAEPVLPHGPNVNLQQPSLPAPATATSAPPSAESEVTAAVSFHDGRDVDLIPLSALAAYQRTEVVMAEAMPKCHLDWTVLAGVGQVLTEHGQQDGENTIDEDGKVDPGIVGAAIRDTRDRRLPDSDAGELDGTRGHDRAVGPMLLAPAAWRDIGVDGDADGTRDPQDIDDAALAAGVLLCVEGENLQRPRQLDRALERMNDAEEFVTEVPKVAAAYEADTFTMTAFPVFSGPSVAYIGAVAIVPPAASPADGAEDEGRKHAAARDDKAAPAKQGKDNDKGETSTSPEKKGTESGKDKATGKDKHDGKTSDKGPTKNNGPATDDGSTTEEPTQEPTESDASPEEVPVEAAPEPEPAPEPDPKETTPPKEAAATAPEEKAGAPANSTAETCDEATDDGADDGADDPADTECDDVAATDEAESTEPTA